MNNYWCQKHGSSDWLGTAGPDGKNGNRDVDGHAIFESVAWSARAIAVDLRSKYRRGLVSAVDIAAVYSPWCDTLGSKAVVNVVHLSASAEISAWKVSGVFSRRWELFAAT